VALQQTEVQLVVQAALPSSATSGVVIVIEVLGVRESDVRAHELKGFAQVITHAFQIASAEDVRCVHQDLQGGAAEFVEKSAGTLCGVDDIVVLGFKGQKHPCRLRR